MVPDPDAVGPVLFAVTVAVAARSNVDAAFTALGALAAIGLFVYLFRSFDDRDLDP